MVTALFTITILVLTIVAFWRSRLLMNAVCVIAWLIWSFLMANQTYPEGNEYLWIAVTAFGLCMTIVMIAMWLREYFGSRIKGPTSDDIQAEHRKKVLKLVQPKGKPWYYEE